MIRFKLRIMILGTTLFISFVSRGAEETKGKAISSIGSLEANWLTGDSDHKLGQLAKHHRGFDMAMVETGYRYSELFFAGQEKNWDYALYQAEKIKVAIENGFERRPKRRSNAEGLFLKSSYPKLIEAIKAKSPSSFQTAFTGITVSCNSCHHAEGVGFIKVHTPTAHLVPVGSHN